MLVLLLQKLRSLLQHTDESFVVDEETFQLNVESLP